MKSSFFALLLGCLIITWTQTLHAQVMTFIVGADTAAPGDTVFVPITVDNFIGISGYQGTVSWDTSILNFIDIISPTSGINNVFGNPGQGIIPLNNATFSWIDFSGGSVTLPAGTEVMRLSFQIKLTAPLGLTPIKMDSSTTNLAYLANSVLAAPLVNQGGVLVATDDLTFDLSHEVGIPGDTVSVSISVDNFDSIAGYQGTLRWDTTLLEFIDLSSSTTGINNIFGTPGQGLIPLDAATFSWLNFSGGTTTLVSGTEVIELRFMIKVGASPGTTPVTMDGSVTSLGYTEGTVLLNPFVIQGSVTINSCTPTSDASFTLPASVCQNGSHPQATIIGDFGGSFSVDNGATIDPVSGVLDLATTTIGSTYTISYMVGFPCPAFTSQSIQVVAPDDAGFTIVDTVCANGANPSASVTGLTGGSFSVDNGATIDPTTGILDLTTTSSGTTYLVSYTTAGICPNTSSQSIFVQSADDASFSLADSVCIFGFNPIPTISGLSGGIFSVDQGASIDANTGELLLSTTSANTTYQVSYQTSGDCPSVSVQNVFVADVEDASFSYPVSSCPSGANPVATITGNAGGVFSISPAATIDPNTGELDLSSTVLGTAYTISYDLLDACQSFSSQIIVIEDLLPPDSVSLADVMGECSATVAIPSMMDNCSGTVDGTTNDPLTYTEQGIYTVNWTFDDGNGNQTTATQMVIINDSTPPVVQCQSLTVQLDPNGLAIITPEQIDNGSSDACGIESLTLSQDTFGVADIGTQSVVLTVMDSSGNSSSCEAVVNVQGSNSIRDFFGSNNRIALDVFPNPAKGQITVEWESDWYGEVLVVVSNQLGQVILQERHKKHIPHMQIDLRLEELLSGVYYIQAYQDSQRLYAKLVKQ